jgi:hypothetical protein
MIRSRFVRSLVVGFTAFGLISCADSPTAPKVAPAQAQAGLLSGLLGGILQPVTSIVGFVADATGLTVHAVKWDAEQPQVSYSVTATIQPWGSTVTLPETDLTVVFPYGAVSQPTTITITSDPNYVAYSMYPHGLKFAKPVAVTQRLRKTAVYGQPLSGKLFGAYTNDDLIDLGKLLHALEIELSTTIFTPNSNNLPDTEVWIINHFSRYMLASG